MNANERVVISNTSNATNKMMMNRLIRQIELDEIERASLEAYYQSRRKAEKANLRYFLVQKLAGILCIGISALDAILLQDLTVGVIFVPLGIYLIFTRERVVK